MNCNRALGMPFFFHSLTEGGLMENMRATAVTPPSRSMMVDGFMVPILGPPKKMSIGRPKSDSVRLAYMEKWAERIAERMREQGKSEADLARAIKLAQPSVFQWFKPNGDKPCTKSIKAESLLGASRFLGLSPEWILTGRGPKELSQYVGLNEHKLAVAIVSVRKAAESAGLVMDEAQDAALIALAYRELSPYPETLTKAQMVDFDGVVRHLLMGGISSEGNERPATGTSQRAIQEPAAPRKKARRSHA